nr:immunoglobulin heavy chain junction region [Macaca mulatta]MOV55117.1 immunoglobulin heavy chain junction region [Macaca mulatta]MOV55770.1 immunoglobulin heavy chain junction region [Macaca mulatta]MOV56442.1 immunoglobulin heavy chain junction region [Macaca mulatta]MOV56589.1 immunoglobulin heavy chain junction region [Macaca mulatta]
CARDTIGEQWVQFFAYW